MKIYIIAFLITGISSLLILSCDDYLDKAPKSNFTEAEVFENYDNLQKFFDAVYNGLPNPNKRDNYAIKDVFNLYFAGFPRKFSFHQMTDLSDGGVLRENQIIKHGQMGKLADYFISQEHQRPIISTMHKVIRTCNITLQKIGEVKDANQQEIDDIIAQAHFVRAFAHFSLFKLWGSWPYITQVIGPYDEWDLPRLTKHETLMRIAADFDTAAIYFGKADRMRRDNPVPGGVGHLNYVDQWRPAGVSAKALKARALLYAASPLNNELGGKDWEEAAKANWEAIQIALQYGYSLLSPEDYKLNFVGAPYTNEQLWGWSYGRLSHTNALLKWLIPGTFTSATDANGDNPTQNTVDKFETIFGDPLNDVKDRAKATALGHYDEQDPYKNRDPRFYIDIIYNEAPIPGFGTAEIYYEATPDGVIYGELNNPSSRSPTQTGYYDRKLWGGQSPKNNVSPEYGESIIRLAELYLNYAEAANEAYGPNTGSPGAITAVDAINLIRQRIGQVDVLPEFTETKEAFRSRIKNERTVELMFEGHYYFDIRRWMDAPVTMRGPLMGINIEKVPISKTYPIGYKHTRMPIPEARQSLWKDEMYYFPFNDIDYFRMINFDTSLNPPW